MTSFIFCIPFRFQAMDLSYKLDSYGKIPNDVNYMEENIYRRAESYGEYHNLIMEKMFDIEMERRYPEYSETSSLQSEEDMNQEKHLAGNSKLQHDKTGVINDSLGQSHSLASSENCFRMKFVLFG